MIQSILLKLGMLAVTVSLVLWIGWPLPQPELEDPRRTAPTKKGRAVTAASTVDPLTPSPAPVRRITGAQGMPSGHGKVRLDLNRATVEELVQLPGIGQVLADRIIAYRKDNGLYHSVHELLDVKGIGEKRFARMKPLVLVGSRPAPSDDATRKPDLTGKRGRRS